MNRIQRLLNEIIIILDRILVEVQFQSDYIVNSQEYEHRKTQLHDDLQNRRSSVGE